jgi:hypothetical protein
MSTSRAFAYNPSATAPTGTIQFGNLAVQSTGWLQGAGDLKWWNGPDEELGYVIARSVPSGIHPTPVPEDKITLSTTYKAVDISLSNNNQTATQVFSYVQSVLNDIDISTYNKVMFSVKYTSTNPSVGRGSHFIGLGNRFMNYSGPFDGYPGTDVNSVGFSDDGIYYYNGGSDMTGLPEWTSGDIIDIAVDNDNGYCWIRVNGGDWNGVDSTLPVTGLPLFSISSLRACLCPSIYGTMTILNAPKHSIPSGFNFLGNELASVGFWRTADFTDSSFINLVNSKLGQNFAAAPIAKNWLNTNGYWTSYLTPILSLDAANYTSGDWVDSVGGKTFSLYNSPSWSANNGGCFTFNSSLSQYAKSTTSLPDLSNWSVGVWHFYDGSETGGAPCIVTETFIGGGINYSLGNNNGGFTSGFFDGGWRITSSFTLTPGNWYYIVGTYDGATLNLYVNNSLVGTANYIGNSISSGSGIRLMTRWDLADYWGGRLATVDIYDKALNSAQVASIWNLTKSRFGL